MPYFRELERDVPTQGDTGQLSTSQPLKTQSTTGNREVFTQPGLCPAFTKSPRKASGLTGLRKIQTVNRLSKTWAN